MFGQREFNEFTKVSYSHTVERVAVEGNQRIILGFTKGTYKAESSFSMTLRKYRELIQFLGNGYFDKTFVVNVSFAPDDGDTIISDEIIGCKLKKTGKDFSKGNDALEVEIELDVVKIKEDGLEPIEVDQQTFLQAA